MRITSLGAKADLPQPRLEFAVSIRADLGPAVEFTTSHGITRAMFPITGGDIAGDGWRATILPGGADFATRLPDGSYAIEARYFARTDDGIILSVLNAGRMWAQPDGSFDGRTRAEIQAPEGPLAALSDAVLFGTAHAAAGDDDHVWIELWRAVL